MQFFEVISVINCKCVKMTFFLLNLFQKWVQKQELTFKPPLPLFFSPDVSQSLSLVHFCKYFYDKNSSFSGLFSINCDVTYILIRILCIYFVRSIKMIKTSQIPYNCMDFLSVIVSDGIWII